MSSHCHTTADGLFLRHVTLLFKPLILSVYRWSGFLQRCRPKGDVPLLLLLVTLVTACSGPQSTLQPSGPSAQATAWLWWGMFWVSVLVLVAVVALWVYALVRKSDGTRDEEEARRIGRRWVIGGGLILPGVSILLLSAFGIPAGHRMLPLPLENGDEPLVIEVVGNQWWWEVHYIEAGVTTANELYLPVGVPVNIQATSNDVIHSFWVPRLAGKIDALPGRTNVLRLEASETGKMRGQCAEFCGLLHAHMALEVEVLPQDEFDSWLAARQRPVQVSPEHQEAAAAFEEYCGDCHRVAGVSTGHIAPDLTTIGSRSLLGGRPRTEDEGIYYWMQVHPTAKMGDPIPDHSEMAPDHLQAIAQWLETLGND